MKPVNTYTGSIEGNLDPEKVIEMGLDTSAEGQAHLLSLLTDMYSDRELACVREYSTNARDAMIDAGKSHLPIHVTTPSSLSPHLVIRDEGVGLSINDLEFIFSQYGASTKRGSDEVNGMLGIGGKAALTYTSQFMVTSVKDGVKAQIVVTRNEDGRGVMEVVDTRATTEGNGVEIRIPVKGRHEFDKKVSEFFYYWKPGTVLVNGKVPENIWSEDGHTKVGDNVFVRKSRYGWQSRNDTIVMGNVAYPLMDDMSKVFSKTVADYEHTVQTIVFVEIGEITFAPSREAVSNTPRTMATIERIKGEMKANIKSQIEGDIVNAGSYSEAFTLWAKWGGIVGAKNVPPVKYQGHEFTDYVKAKYSALYIGKGRHNYTTGVTGDRATSTEGMEKPIGLHDLYDSANLVVVNYPNDGAPSGGSRRKVKAYIEQLTDEPDAVIFMEKMVGAPWTDEIPTVDWDIIKAIPLPKNGSVGGGKVGKIPVTIYKGGIATFSDGTMGQWHDEPIDPNKPVTYVSPADLKDRWNNSKRRAIQTIHQFDPEIQIVLLGKNRWDKFVTENPGAKELSAYYGKDFPKMVKESMTDDELFYADHDSDWREAAKILGGDTLDADMTRLAKIAKTVDTNRVSVYNGMVEPTKALSRQYPLVPRHYIKEHKSHTITYINAVIKEGK
jgi:hypothetical protein